MHFAEFGVVMMLFLVGLELQPSLLAIARPDSGTRRLAGGGYDRRRHHQFHLWPGKWLWLAILSLSSTAIVLQTLKRRG